MMDRGHGDGCGIHAAGKLGHRCQCLAAKLCRDRLSLRQVGINHRDQLHALALLLKFVIHTGVISAERTNTNDSDADCILVSQVNDFLRPALSTATSSCELIHHGGTETRRKAVYMVAQSAGFAD